ncbi:hypothetical protein [Methanoculleus methanifontis]|uniref:hypothetical protein n=1 Tax=Methanoculleus methanifontis TaxID=2584086 RepID=UPI0026582E7A|nr:hypothetical protein [Methanoculleus sp. FWC-SCC3]
MDILKYQNRLSILGDGMSGRCLLTYNGDERARCAYRLAPGAGVPEREERAGGER